MKQLKSRITIILAVVLLISMIPWHAAAAETQTPIGELTNFVSGEPQAFDDVKQGAWYARGVATVSAAGLMNGTDPGRFSPNDTLTLGEVVTIVARFRAIYLFGNTDELEQSGPAKPWYARYFAALEQAGLIDESCIADAERPVKRETVGVMLSEVIEAKDLAPINQIDSIPDCTSALQKSLLPLYRAGVLTGNDAAGSFEPNSILKRSEMATILSRVIMPSMRKQTLFVAGGKGKLSNFTQKQLLAAQFADTAKSPYAANVKVCYEAALMSGESATWFNLNGTVTLAQTAAIAARFHSVYYSGSTMLLDAFPKGKNWYDSSFDYLEKAGLLPSDWRKTPNKAATREQTLQLLVGMVAASDLPAINTVRFIPDYNGKYLAGILRFYNAGVLTGRDEYGTLAPNGAVKRSEMAAILSRIVCTDLRKKYTLKVKMEIIEYGKSGAGRSLKAYRFGNGPNAFVMTFAVHGWEDNFARDGQELVNTANALIKTLQATPSLADDWTIYILPMCNPDGLLDGNDCNGPGRRTVYSYNAAGKLVRKGVDINRSFPYGYIAESGERNYNLPHALACPEAVGIQKILLEAAKLPGNKFFLDVHGWYNQIIVSNNGGIIRDAFAEQFSGTRPTIMGRHGYLCEYAASLGYRSGLFEFPEIYSHAEFVNRKCESKFIAAIKTILKRGK